ncbi:MAG TPA: DNA-directed RNA polymerase subunit alpha [Planctomycetaceae bacterium]|nr:DNA-directed RNA polymerase subunit alpha [Planctomycetaceae bacterium]HCP10977.1 DNA-directed RNA polymerase subunit alpha [Planctomycetaceae bacterium]
MPFVIARICVSQEANEVPSASSLNIKEFFESDSLLTLEQLQQLEYAAGTSQLTEIRQAVGDLARRVESGEKRESVVARAGVGSYVLSRQSQADRLLSAVSGDGVALFAHGQCLTALGRPDEAAGRFEAAARLGVDPVGCALRRAGAIRAAGRVDEAEKLLRSVAASAASRAEYSFQMGCIWADRGDSLTAVEYFERAVDMDPHHSRALFWLAAENALRGNDEEAIRLYERSLSRPPFYVGALLNLGLLYEDRENYQAAAFCFRRVREYDPNNVFAELYLKDIEATQGMYYDEDHAKQEARMKHLLSRPVTDFELSVRSRNCLQAMNIVSLGDLTEVSEQELLAGKNFGETSLMEIRELLQAHGLRIGQNLHKIHSREHVVDQSLSPEEQAMMNKLVTDLNLSVRSRKCMSRLNIQTIGQLCQRTPDELLASRNFGVTSLNEIRQKLSEVGIRLRND